MSLLGSAVRTDPTPTPTPVSDERPAFERQRRIEELIERHAHTRAVDDLPPELRDNPMIVSIVSASPEDEARDIAACEAHREALESYGDDPARILAAFEAGTHPLQRLALSGR